MSLPAIAQHMAAHGRNGDSMLVHMTPHEVAGLQKLAEKHGTSLTINPHTGLPEAFSLGSLAKAAIPVLAGAALGPAGFGLAETALGAATMVGGVSALASGNLSQGLMAGLGAYGGFGLGAGLSAAGEAALGSEATAANIMNENMALEEAKAAAAQTAKSAAPWEKLAAGANSVTGSGGLQALQAGMPAGGPGVMGSAAAAAAPILADKMTPTTTPMPAQTPAYIRQYSYNPYGQKYTAMAPVDASKWGSRSFEDAFKAADGGIVALAHGGGVSGYADGGYTQYTPEQMSDYFAKNPDVNVADAVKQFNADPNAVNQFVVSQIGQYKDPTATQSGTGYLGAYQNLTKEGMTPEEFAAASQGMNKDWGAAGSYWNPETVSHAYDVGAKILQFDPQTDKVTPSDKEWVQFMDANKFSVDDISRATGLATNEVQRRYDAAKEKPVVKTAMPAQTDTPTTPLTGIANVPSVANVSTALPGDITKNTDGTVTVHPNIPGGSNFTGMGDVKNRYTTGGGSLGYAPYVPKTAAEHAAMYGTQTGGSKAAYDYLMGQGAYPTNPTTPTGEVMKPYAQSVLGMPVDQTAPAFVWDPVNRRYIANPKYVKPLTIAEQTAAAEKAKADAAAKEAVGSVQLSAKGGLMGMASGGLSSLGGYSDGGRLLKGPGDGVSDSIPASIGDKQPARLADGEFVVPARIVSELGNGSTDAGARKLYQMMDRVQKARGKTTGKGKVATNSRADKYLPV